MNEIERSESAEWAKPLPVPDAGYAGGDDGEDYFLMLTKAPITPTRMTSR